MAHSAMYLLKKCRWCRKERPFLFYYWFEKLEDGKPVVVDPNEGMFHTGVCRKCLETLCGGEDAVRADFARLLLDHAVGIPCGDVHVYEVNRSPATNMPCMLVVGRP